MQPDRLVRHWQKLIPGQFQLQEKSRQTPAFLLYYFYRFKPPEAG